MYKYAFRAELDALVDKYLRNMKYRQRRKFSFRFSMPLKMAAHADGGDSCNGERMLVRFVVALLAVALKRQ